MKFEVILFSALMSAVSFSWADSIDFSLSNDSVRAELSGELTNKRLNYTVGALHNETHGDVGSVGLQVSDRLKASTGALTAAVGGKFVGFDADHGPDGSAFAIGGYLQQHFDAANLVTVRGDFYYAPRVVSWGKAEHYAELGLRLEYRLVDQAIVYLGFRKIQAEFKNISSDMVFDESGHLGLQLFF